MAYFDAANERVADQWAADVEAVRIGTVAGSDRKANERWQRERNKMKVQPEQGLTGAALERAIMTLAQAHPDLVVVR